MKISDTGLKFLEQYEKFEPKPYAGKADKPGVCTIGIGTTHYPDGTKVTLNDPEITEAQAWEYVSHYLENIAYPELSKYALNQNQFDALCSFIYNEGLGNFNISSLKTKIEFNPSDETIRNEFSRWIYANHVIVNGLVSRRQAEAELYFS